MTMKIFIISISLTLIVLTSFGQTYWTPNFDLIVPNNGYTDLVYIDTFSNPNCIWQVGHPTKTVFTNAHSVPNAIVTDTLNPVPPNDTSIFYLQHLKSDIPWCVFALHFWYQTKGDSTDRGIIEVSPDSAHSVWINLLTQDTTYNFQWWSEKPTLTGSTVGWKEFDLYLLNAGSTIGSYNLADTILFRFTYITDNINTLHDGWMIDDIGVDDWMSGISEIQNDNLISVYPNPTTDHLTIQRNKSSDKQSVKIFDYTGQVLSENQNFAGETIDTRQLNNGVYLLKYSDTKSFSIKKFIVNH